ncbi:MAG TPA: SDR family NAD(P)-dependent oxidoreductase [Solirubrobacterales bacterium]|nr:SDR family NAD(P)-dependent oxidoreductase [Solirubrobacterales bacterium]
MAGRVEGKVAVVSGAGNGIGRASFAMLGREGAKVVGTARREEKLNEALETVRAALLADGGCISRSFPAAG